MSAHAAAEWPEATGSSRQALEKAVADRPYLATAAAAGVGFLLGGGLTGRVLVLLLGAGGRVAGSWLSDEILGRSARTDRSTDGGRA